MSMEGHEGGGTHCHSCEGRNLHNINDKNPILTWSKMLSVLEELQNVVLLKQQG